MSTSRRLAPWLGVGALTIALTTLTTTQALRRYDELNSGWSWDLAYNNQWFWDVTHGIHDLTVRPLGPHADEGPWVWKMNHLGLIRIPLIPIYWLFPDPRTLLVVQNVMLWWVIPAAFTLVRSETKSDALALSAAALVPGTPLLWPLVWNDFREIQLAFPFILWAIQGYRNRDLRLTLIGFGGMVASRQEFALVAASFAIIPPKEPEDIGRSYRWSQGILMLGLGWMLLVFFGYLKLFVGKYSPELYIQQFQGPKAPIGQTLATASDFLMVGLGSWVVLACFVPRVGVLVLPWVWSLASGKWALHYLGTPQWHHVRWTAPFVGVGLAAGLLGYARLATWLGRRRGGRWLVGALWLATALGLLAATREVQARFARVERVVPLAEVEEIWRWIRRVGPGDAVVADFPVTAPLSSRQFLYSYIVEINKPKGYPRLSEAFRWVFLGAGVLPPEVFLDQGFACVYRGPTLWIFRREGGPRGDLIEKKSEMREHNGPMRSQSPRKEETPPQGRLWHPAGRVARRSRGIGA